MTTFIILVNAIVKFAENNQIEYLNNNELSEIKTRYIVEYQKPKRILKAYKFGYEKDNPSFEYLRYNILGEDASGNLQETFYMVINPLVTGKAGIFALIENVLNKFPNETPVNQDWIISPYAPTPTIVEAAKTLYESHSVENITRHEADKVSTDTTIKYISVL